MSQESKSEAGSAKVSNAELLNKLKIDSDTIEESSRYPTALIVGGLAAAVLIFIVLMFVVSGDKSNADGPRSSTSSQALQSEPIETKKVQSEPTKSVAANTASGSGNEILNASGYVVARVRATVSAEIMGRIDTVLVEEGMFVEQGQILAEIDSTIAAVDWQLAKARVSANEQRLAAIEAERSEAARVLGRLAALNDKQFISEAEISRARSSVDATSAQLKALRAELKVTQLSAQRQKEFLEKHTLRAPFSGVVTVKNAQPGEIISPSSAGGGFTRTGICTVVDMDSLEIEVDVNESFIGRVFQGQRVLATLDAYPDWQMPAKVIAVIPTADRAKATVRVRIGIQLSDSRILPEMGVKVTFYEDALNEDENND